ncbi:MAG: hypothetical protein RID53_19200 [Coleofasciculus sp. B1-GNL1-01]|uniref:hypothetical protein n=1 Tax=Coleofasciculus sp. B1-GNL1-01 TaxID=3068484 RepID=UPI0032F31379
MSNYPENVQPFFDWIKEEAGLFSAYKDELEVLAEELKNSNNKDAAEERLDEWLEIPSHSEISQAYDARLAQENPFAESNVDGKKGFAGSESPTKPGEPSESSKILQDNLMIKNTPLSQPPPPPPQPPQP